MAASTKLLSISGACALFLALLIYEVSATVVTGDGPVEEEQTAFHEATDLWRCIQTEIPEEDQNAGNQSSTRINQFCGRQDTIKDCLRERSANLTQTLDDAKVMAPFMRDLLVTLVSFACDNNAEMLTVMSKNDNGDCFVDNLSFCHDNSTFRNNSSIGFNCDQNNEGGDPKTVEDACCQILRVFECTEKEITSCQGDVLNVLAAAKSALKNEGPCEQYYRETKGE